MDSTTIVENGVDPKLQNRRPWTETPLDPTRSCIRILTLHKGSDDMPVRCSLKVASLDEDPLYETLSYVWGDPNDTKPITVNATPFNATANLFDFLHWLRLPTEDRHIWADAICIDQENEQEKNYQIGLMSTIYRKAKEAHIWFGPFCTSGPKSWMKETASDKGYSLACELTPEMWDSAEDECAEVLVYFLGEEGFRPLSQKECNDFSQRCHDDIFLETLAVLDKIAGPSGGEHLYQYPVFSFIEKEGGHRGYEINRAWPMVIDCIQWLISRPWWGRVWTLQEAVLPGVDPIVHAPPYSFKLSRLLNGICAMLRHNTEQCCKWMGNVILTGYREHERRDCYTQSIAIFQQRNSLMSQCQQIVPLEIIVHSKRGRKATEIRDHWFGIQGFLHPDWQEKEKNCFEWTTAEIFSKCTKLMFTSCKDLTRLAFARRLMRSKVSGLPSWALDLSDQVPQDEDEYDHWNLYNASKRVNYVSDEDWLDLRNPNLTVKAIRMGTILKCGGQIISDASASLGTSGIILNSIKDWHRLYHDHARSANENAFWRTIFMDRHPQRHWMHERTKSLPDKTVAKIREWWKHWETERDCRDLDVNRKANDGSYGSFQYRAVSLNVEKTTFFVTSQGTPGMGPHNMQPSDEVYALAGCKALTVLRRGSRNGADRLTFVGLCFLDTWMYGKATWGSPAWETLQLY